MHKLSIEHEVQVELPIGNAVPPMRPRFTLYIDAANCCAVLQALETQLAFCAVSNLCISDLSAWLSCFTMASTIHSHTPPPGSVVAAAADVEWDGAMRVSQGLGVGWNSTTNF